MLNLFSQHQHKPELVIPIGHTDTVQSVCFSSDGLYALSGSGDNTLIIWDVQTGQEIRVLEGHTNLVQSVSFSPDGRYALSGSWDEKIKLWDIQTGQELRSFEGHNSRITSICFSPDGRQVLSGSSKSTIKLWDIETGMEIRSFEGHGKDVMSICYSLDGMYELSVSYDHKLKLWDIQTDKMIHSFEAYEEEGNTVCFSPDGQNILSVSSGGAIKIWSKNFRTEFRSFSVQEEGVLAVSLSPDGRYILTGKLDHTVELWDIRIGKKIRGFSGCRISSIRSLDVSLDGRNILLGREDHSVLFWGIQTGQKIRSFYNHTDAVQSVCFSPDGLHALSGSYLDKQVQLWDLQNGIKAHSLKAFEVESVCFSPDGRFALSSNSDGLLIFWDTISGEKIISFESGFESFCFSHDAKSILSGTWDGTIVLWDTQDIKKIRAFEGHKKAVYCVCFSFDCQFALSGSSDSTIRLWDVQTGNEIYTLKGHDNIVYSVCFSPNGQLAMSGSYNSIIVWDIQNGKEICSFKHAGKVTSVCFSPDSRYALSGSRGTIKLWDVQNQQLIRTIEGNYWNDPVGRFYPNSPYLLASSGDSFLKFWDISSGQELATLLNLDNDDWIIATPSGHFDASDGALSKIHYTIGLETIGFDQLVGRYHIPDLLSILLSDGKEDLPKAPLIENILLHPLIEAGIVKDTLILNLKNRGGGIGRVLVYVEDLEFIEDAREQPAKDCYTERLTIRVDLLGYCRFFIPGELNELTVFCENKDGTLRSKPIKLSYSPESLVSKGESTNNTAADPQDKELPNPVKLHGVFIGSNTRGLKFAGSDADEMANIVRSASKNLYGDHITISVFSGINLIKDKVLEEFDQMSRRLSYQDIVVIFLSGHATTKGEFKEYYFILKDNRTAESIEQIIDSPEMRGKCTLSLAELRKLVNKIPARKKILILDTCNSGHVAGHFGIVKSARAESFSQVKIINEIRRSTGFCILASCAENQESFENKRFKHGLMTYSILNGISTGEGLLKKSDNREYIEPVTLFNYVKAKTEKLADGANKAQIPNIFMPKSLDLLIGEVTAEEKKSIQLTGILLFTRSSINPVEYDHYLGFEKLTDNALKRQAGLGYLEFTERLDQPDVCQILGSYRIQSGNLVVQCWLNKGGQRLEGSKMEIVRPVTELEKAAAEIVETFRNIVSNSKLATAPNVEKWQERIQNSLMHRWFPAGKRNKS